MTPKKTMRNNDFQESKFLLYQSDNEDIKIDVFLQNESVWLTQKMMSELFNSSVDNISLHLKNIYADNELEPLATSEKFSIVQNEGGRSVNRKVKFYNLDVIIAVGYRVNSKQATKFRIWATKILKEYIVKGFVLDDERLKQGKELFGQDYFQELLERIRSIRASERREFIFK